jgi:hypothetical protein
MTSYKTNIDSEVQAVLEKATVSPTLVTLSADKISRELYLKVNKVLEAAGGKWNRAKKGHVFTEDPSEKLGLALASGSIVDERRVKQQFFTPTKTAEYVCDVADIKAGNVVLEPSAGGGSLARAAKRRDASVSCVELDPNLVTILKADFPFTRNADFLDTTPDPRYHAVVMNPPFAKDQAITHVLHAFKFLRPFGKLVAITPVGCERKSNKVAKELAGLISQCGRVELLPDDAFDGEEVKAGVRTQLIILINSPIPDGSSFINQRA